MHACVYVCIYACVHMRVCMHVFLCVCVCSYVRTPLGDQRTTCENWFSPSTAWVPRIQLKLGLGGKCPLLLSHHPCLHLRS